MLRQSETRQAINKLLEVDERTPEQDTELHELTGTAQRLEVEYRGALVAEQGKVEVHVTPDSEDRERAALRDKATVSGFLMAAMAGRLPSGAEAAYSDACGVEPGAIPIDIFESDRPKIEQHADATTPSPTTGTGTTVGRIAPYVFDQSIAARKLGIGMPTVPSGRMVRDGAHDAARNGRAESQRRHRRIDRGRSVARQHHGTAYLRATEPGPRKISRKSGPRNSRRRYGRRSPAVCRISTTSRPCAATARVRISAGS